MIQSLMNMNKIKQSICGLRPPLVVTQKVGRVTQIIHCFAGRLLEEGAYLSEGCLHLFLQTPLTVEEIAECTRTHSSATDIIRTVEAFSVTSPSGER